MLDNPHRDARGDFIGFAGRIRNPRRNPRPRPGEICSPVHSTARPAAGRRSTAPTPLGHVRTATQTAAKRAAIEVKGDLAFVHEPRALLVPQRVPPGIAARRQQPFWPENVRPCARPSTH
jgi:hypothetical protein